MLASIIKFSSIPPHQISRDYQGRINSKLLLMNHFTNCIAPTFVFPATGTSLIDTNADVGGGGGGGGQLPVGYNDPWLFLGRVTRALPSSETLRRKNWKNQDPVKGPRLFYWGEEVDSGPLLCYI